jgi:hypothetical protein
MCGCIKRTRPREALAKEFGVTRFAEVDSHARYKAAPSQVVETIVAMNGEKCLGPIRWPSSARTRSNTGCEVVVRPDYVSRKRAAEEEAFLTQASQ